MNQKKTVSTLIVLGSGKYDHFDTSSSCQFGHLGGHTTEMFRLLSGTNRNVYKPRYYMIASTDKMSAKKMNEFEQNVSKENFLLELFCFCRRWKILILHYRH